MDTIAIQTKGSLISYLPIIVGNDLMISYEEYFNLYDKKTGERKWAEFLNGRLSPKLINSMDNVYLNSGIYSVRFTKYNIKENKIFWHQNYLLPPSFSSDFEVLDNEIIYVSTGFGKLMVIDDESGESIVVDDQNLENISNPKLYKEKNILVSHSKNKIIGFTIK